MVAAARERGLEVTGELELAWRAIPNPSAPSPGPTARRPRPSCSATSTARPGCRWRSPATSARRSPRWRGSSARGRDRRLRGSSFQLEDSSAFAPECARAAQPRAGPPRPPRDDRGLPGGEAADLRQPGERRRRRLQRRDARAGRTATSAAARGGCASARRGARRRRRPRLRAEPARRGDLRRRGAAAGASSELRLLGAHNVENAMGAAAAALAAGVPRDAVAEGLRSFEGVPHRLERVRERRRRPLRQRLQGDERRLGAGRASTPSRAACTLILGGSLKGESFERLVDPVIERCLACYLIGEAAERAGRGPGAGRRAAGSSSIAAARWSARSRPPPPARSRARSCCSRPACASFDAFADFEERGERFRELVEALVSGEAPEAGGAADRVLAAADGDALPARARAP